MKRVSLGIALGVALVLAPALLTAQEPDGAALYAKSCKSCHGPDGTPPAKMASMYEGLKALQPERSVDSIAADISKGVGKMKGYAGKMTDAEVMAVAKFVKTLKPAAAPPAK